jgi:uncharacterized protein (TIGR02594 family)
MMTAYDLAARFIGLQEIPGGKDNPLIVGMLQLAALDGVPGDFVHAWPQHDEVPWCGAAVYFVAWLLGLKRPITSKTTGPLAARSWLTVGQAVPLDAAIRGFDVVVLERGAGGHVGWYHAQTDADVLLLAGNQKNTWSVAPFPRARVLGVRRLA